MKLPRFDIFFMFTLLGIGRYPNASYVCDFNYMCICCVYNLADFFLFVK